MKIAVIGSGISGLGIAYLGQANGHEVHLFEKANYFGGHSNTIQITEGSRSFYADTGFLVHNPRTYPNLLELLSRLNVKTVESQMTLSIQVLERNVEWGGTNIRTLFAQKANLFRPGFYRMIYDLLRFNRLAPTFLEQLTNDPKKTLGQLLVEKNFSTELRDWYLIPMAAAIWSTPASKILEFPAFTFLRFCMNHNLLQTDGRPLWRTIEGGSRNYVNKIVDTIQYKHLNCNIRSVSRSDGKVKVKFNDSDQTFDKVVFATHADQTRQLLEGIQPDEEQILSHFHFQKNKAVVHSDQSVLPQRKELWSAWNYASSMDSSQVSVSYLLNHLQNLPTKVPIIVTLNPHKRIADEKIIRTIEYDHPVFDVETIKAQGRISEIQGREGIYHTGAWLGYGFHEDGLKSALRVARALGLKIPWSPIYE
jgi:predicted NAD/FAD-binding protein